MDWLLQALASQIVWEILLMLGVGAALAFLKSKWPQYANPSLYGLAGITGVAVLGSHLLGDLFCRRSNHKQQ